MGAFKNFSLLIYYNTLGLPLGIKMLFAAAAIAVLAQKFGVSSETAWGVALTTVIFMVCVVNKNPTSTGELK